MMTADQIVAAIPTCSLGWAVALTEAMPKWHIDTDSRQLMFLAQCAHESAGFTRLVEGLNYSAQGLMRTWPNRFPNLTIAAQYEHRDQAIANYVYANRMGNGNEASGDGWTFRGRGPIQQTGRNAYRAAGAALGYPFERYPQDMAAPTYGAQAAAWYWHSNGLNELADRGEFIAITKRINGGLTGLAEREKWLADIQQRTGDDGRRLA